jgi:hypothetical protein
LILLQVVHYFSHRTKQDITHGQISRFENESSKIEPA